MSIRSISHIFQRELRNLREYIKYPSWALYAASGAADNHLYKSRRIRAIQRRYHFHTFVETGTFYGQMTAAMRPFFDKLVSVEIFRPLYEANLEVFACTPKVSIRCGDSAAVLASIMDADRDDILFWLDGHYSGPGTGQGDEVTPIIKELQVILAARPKRICIIIDDYRLFQGGAGYPPAEQVEQMLRQYDPPLEVTIDRDAIVAVSRGASDAG